MERDALNRDGLTRDTRDGIYGITCPLGTYWRAFVKDVLVAETVTEAEAKAARQHYMEGYEACRKTFQFLHENPIVPYTNQLVLMNAAEPDAVVVAEPVVETIKHEKKPTVKHTLKTSKKHIDPPHPSRLAVQNGVLQFFGTTVRLHPSDATLSFRTGRIGPYEAIPYTPWIDGTEDSIELMGFLDAVFPDPDVREYVLCAVASCLDGVSRFPNLFLCHGSGSNGKSAFQSLVELTLGDYAKSLQAEMLCRKTQPDSLTKVVGGSRWIAVGEPPHGSSLCVASVNHLLEGMPAHVFLFTCELPLLKADDALWSRIRVIPFMTTFVARNGTRDGTRNGDTSDCIEQDIHIQSKLTRWRTAFLSLLVDRFSAATGLARAEPDRVSDATLLYRRANDPFKKFVSEYLIPDDETPPLDSVGLRKLYREFKTHHKCDLKESELLERLLEADGFLYGFRPIQTE